MHSWLSPDIRYGFLSNPSTPILSTAASSPCSHTKFHHYSSTTDLSEALSDLSFEDQCDDESIESSPLCRSESVPILHDVERVENGETIIPNDMLNLGSLQSRDDWISVVRNSERHSFTRTGEAYRDDDASICLRLTAYLLHLRSLQNHKNDDLVCPAFEIFESHQQTVKGLQEFITRISTEMCCSYSCFVLAGVYMDRLLIQCPQLRLSSTNIARLFFTSLVLSIKYIDDSFFSNQYYARICGDNLKSLDLRNMEIIFLSSINYELFVSPESFSAAESIQSILIDSAINRHLTLVKVFSDLDHRLSNTSWQSTEWKQHLKVTPLLPVDQSDRFYQMRPQIWRIYFPSFHHVLIGSVIYLLSSVQQNVLFYPYVLSSQTGYSFYHPIPSTGYTIYSS